MWERGDAFSSLNIKFGDETFLVDLNCHVPFRAVGKKTIETDISIPEGHASFDATVSASGAC